MKKRFIPTIIVVIVFTILLIYANKYETDEIPEPGKDKTVQLAKLTIDEVQKIIWKNQDSEVTVEAKKSNGTTKYNITSPRNLPGDEDEIKGVIRSFEDLKSEYTIIATNPVDFGISTNSPILTFITATQTLSFTLGDNAPVGGSVYIQKSGDSAIYFVPSYISTAFNKKVDDLRSKRFFEETFPEVTSITVLFGTETIKLEKDKTTYAWKILEPRQVDADTYEVNSLISGINNIKVNRFIEGDEVKKRDYGFATSAYHVSLNTASGVIDFITGQVDGAETYITKGDMAIIGVVSESSLSLLRKDFNKLRSKQLPTIDEFKLSEVNLKFATQTYKILPKATDTWDCDGINLEATEVRNLVTTYKANLIKEFIELGRRANEGLEKLDDCAFMEFKTQDKVVKVYFGLGHGTDISIYIENEKEIYKVPIQTFEEFKKLVDKIENKKKELKVSSSSSNATETIKPSSSLASPTSTQSSSTTFEMPPNSSQNSHSN